MSASDAKQNNLLLIAVHISCTWFVSSTQRHASMIPFGYVIVKLMPCLGRTRWHFAVALDGGRCFVSIAAVNPGKVWS